MLSRDSAKYRPDVDGMRALAVGLVIVNHLSTALLPGGFVGVDMFFVISGFVVTRSILRTESANAIGDIGRFWRRRFFRIFPILALVVLATLLGEVMFMPPFPHEVYMGNTRSGLAALLGVGNLYLYRLGLDYFQNLSSNPFVHTWSLGVEEQFYLFYSIAFIGLPRMFGNPRQIATARLAGLALLGVLSFALFMALAQSDPMKTYYFLPTRFWELAAGGLIATATDQFGIRIRTDAKLAGAAQIAALLLLATSAVWKTAAGTYPTLPIAGAVLATVILVVAGPARGALVSRLLEHRAFVFCGLISYSLYLWHYPILTLFRYTVGLNSMLAIASALALMFGLSVLTYRHVELPWRMPANRTFPKIAPYLAGVLGAIAIVLAGAWIFPGVLFAGKAQAWASEWWPSRDYSYVAGAEISANHCMLSGDASVPRQIPQGCASPVRADMSPKIPTILAIGDSFGEASWATVAYAKMHGTYRMKTLVYSGCSIYLPPKGQSPTCADYWAQIPSLIHRSIGPGGIVFVSVQWSDHPNAIASARLATYAEIARQRGASLVVQAPIPHFSVPAYFCTPQWFRTDYSGCTRNRGLLESEYAHTRRMLDALSKQNQNLHVWNPTSELCPRPECEMFRNGKPIYRDQLHISYYGARFLGPSFLYFLQHLHDRKLATIAPAHETLKNPLPSVPIDLHASNGSNSR